MKVLKALVLGALLFVGGCSTMPYDKDAELDTINKKLLVVGAEVQAVIQTANDLYEAGVIQPDTSTFRAIDQIITQLNDAWMDLYAVKSLAEFDLQEANLRKVLLNLRQVLTAISCVGCHGPSRGESYEWSSQTA